jgi:hypothetical protein
VPLGRPRVDRLHVERQIVLEDHGELQRRAPVEHPEHEPPLASVVGVPQIDAVDDREQPHR